MRELVYYVAVSLDGFIAGPKGQFDSFVFEGDHATAMIQRFPETIPTDLAEHLGIDQSDGRFSTVLMGWNTYAAGGVPSPYRHLEQIVFSRTRSGDAENLTLTSTDPRETVRELKERSGGDIWLCGGGSLAAELLDEVDRIVVKLNPVLFRSGIPMFGPASYDPLSFELTHSKVFDSGVVIMEYEKTIQPSGRSDPDPGVVS